jgi:hypothetical protein
LHAGTKESKQRFTVTYLMLEMQHVEFPTDFHDDNISMGNEKNHKGGEDKKK